MCYLFSAYLLFLNYKIHEKNLSSLKKMIDVAALRADTNNNLKKINFEGVCERRNVVLGSQKRTAKMRGSH